MSKAHNFACAWQLDFKNNLSEELSQILYFGELLKNPMIENSKDVWLKPDSENVIQHFTFILLFYIKDKKVKYFKKCIKGLT